MEFKLTEKCQNAKRSPDGKSRNWMIFFVNGVQVFKQKRPFNEHAERGFDGKWSYENIYLLNGYIYQTRFGRAYDKELGWIRVNERHVKYPLSKKKLVELGVPADLKIELTD